MKRYRFEFVLAAIFVLISLVAWHWQHPNKPLSTQEINKYMEKVEKLPCPPEERAELLKYTQLWMENDDGKPVYMLNLMRLFPELHHFSGTPENHLTPQKSNEYYESVVIPLLFKLGSYPLYSGNAQGKNLVVHEPVLDDWNRVLVVRYPSRRAFMDLVSDPVFLKVEPYKLMALKVVLTPTSSEMVIPEISSLIIVTLIIVFLAIGWWRASKRKHHPALSSI